MLTQNAKVGTQLILVGARLLRVRQIQIFSFRAHVFGLDVSGVLFVLREYQDRKVACLTASQVQGDTRSSLVEPGHPGCSCDIIYIRAHTLIFLVISSGIFLHYFVD